MNVALEAIEELTRAKNARHIAEQDAERAALAHENAVNVAWACAWAAQAKYDTLKTIRRNMIDEVVSLGRRLGDIESDMSRAANEQERRGAIYGDHPLPGLEKQHDEVTKAREVKKHQVELIEKALAQ